MKAPAEEWGREEAFIHEQAATVGKWGSLPLGTLGHCEARAFELPYLGSEELRLLSINFHSSLFEGCF